jgi:tol-pal system protein YbgF
MKGSIFVSLTEWRSKCAAIAKCAIIAATAVLLLSAPATAQDSRNRPSPSAAGGAQRASDSGQIEKRLEHIEEQLVDMQSMVGAVESLAKNGGGGQDAAGGGGAGYGNGEGGGDVSARVQSIETQLRALSSQMSEILDRLSRLDGQSGGGSVRGGRQGAVDPQPGGRRTAGAEPQSSFGGTTIEPAEQDAGDSAVAVGPAAGQRNNGGGAYSRDSSASDSGRATGGDLKQRFAATPQTSETEPARASSAEARRAYDQAYNLLIARDFRGATDGFTQFLQHYSNDGLAGSAQYWLGQASFELGEYRKAADMFLKGYTNYPKSEKAPESLLKLGIALKRLNEKDAACDSFTEFGRRFPQAPQTLQQRAEQEKRRAGCSG